MIGDNEEKPSKPLLSSLQEIASSLLQRLARSGADKKEKSTKERRRGRRRRADGDENNQNRRLARKRRREKGRSKRSRREKINQTAPDASTDQHKSSRLTEDDSRPEELDRWDNMSIDM